MENDSLKSAITVAVALIVTAVWLRRRYGSVGEMWAMLMERRLNLSPAAVMKALFVATAVLWVAVWLFTTSEQRAELKEWFQENNPWAPVVDAVDPAAK